MDKASLLREAARFDEQSRKHMELGEKFARKAKLALKLAAEFDDNEEGFEGDSLSVRSSDDAKPTTAAQPPNESAREPAFRGNSWTKAMLPLIEAEKDGIDYADLRVRFDGTEFADKLKVSDKGFYGALMKLERLSKIQRKDGRAYSREAYLRISGEIVAGVRAEWPAPSSNSSHTSPVGDAVVAFLKTRPKYAYTYSKHIVAHLRDADPEFREAIDRNPTHIYNVLSRLVRRGVVEKSDVLKAYRMPTQRESGNESGPPVEGGPVRSEGSHPSLDSSKPLNGVML